MLICHKNLPTNQPTNQPTLFLYLTLLFLLPHLYALSVFPSLNSKHKIIFICQFLLKNASLNILCDTFPSEQPRNTTESHWLLPYSYMCFKRCWYYYYYYYYYYHYYKYYLSISPESKPIYFPSSCQKQMTLNGRKSQSHFFFFGHLRKFLNNNKKKTFIEILHFIISTFQLYFLSLL